MTRVTTIMCAASLVLATAAQTPSTVDLRVTGLVLRSADGVPIEYVLGRPASRVAIQIVDSRGRLVRSFTGVTDAGQHRLVWDLRHAGPAPPEGLPPTTDGPRGPLAAPGAYLVRLLVDSATLDRPLVLQREPALPAVPDDDLVAQVELALRIRDRMSQAAQAVVDLRSLKTQVAERVPLARSPAVGLAADVVTRRLNQVEQALLSDRWVALGRRIEAGARRPAAADAEAFETRAAEQDAAIEAVRGVVGNEIAAFNNLLANGGQTPLALPPTLPSPR